MISQVKDMNEILEQALLYDFYGELLTDHQKEVYEQFVLEDLSPVSYTHLTLPTKA